MKSPETTDEMWRPIPNFEGAYEVSSRGRVRSVDRSVTRRNGIQYTVQGRLRRVSIDKRDGLRYVALATGCRGRYVTIYPRKLVAEVFGDRAAS